MLALWILPAENEELGGLEAPAGGAPVVEEEYRLIVWICVSLRGGNGGGLLGVSYGLVTTGAVIDLCRGTGTSFLPNEEEDRPWLLRDDLEALSGWSSIPLLSSSSNCGVVCVISSAPRFRFFSLSLLIEHAMTQQTMQQKIIVSTTPIGRAIMHITIEG